MRKRVVLGFMLNRARRAVGTIGHAVRLLQNRDHVADSLDHAGSFCGSECAQRTGLCNQLIQHPATLSTPVAVLDVLLRESPR
jgi:hypothetical protein